MKILYLNPFSKFAAVRQFNLAKALAEKGHKVTLMLPKSDKYSGYEKVALPNIPNLSFIHPKVLPFKRIFFRFLLYIPSGLWKVRKREFDIVHGFRPLPFSGLLGYWIAKRKHIPFVLEMGDAEWQSMKELNIHPGYQIKIVQRIEEKLLHDANEVTTMSQYLAQYLEDHYQRSVKTVPSGIDVNVFSPKNKDNALTERIKKNLGVKHLLVFIGKLEKAGHITDLIRGFSRVKGDAGLVIVGEGPGKKELQDLAKKLQVEKKCLFVGRVQHEEVPKYLNTADVLVAPFVQSGEGMTFVFNLKILEYMGMEKPIVASKVGMLESVLEGCGHTYPAGDVRTFAQQIDELLKNPEQTKKFGKTAREKVEKFNWPDLSEKMYRIYEDTVKNFRK